MNSTPDISVAQQINDQIGHRAFVMMGTKHRLATPNSLSFDIHGCREFNKVQITLDTHDTYTVEFFQFRNFERTNYRAFGGIYVDQLHGLIESTTGLFLHL